MLTELENYIPLFEAYLKTENTQDFVSKVTDPNHKRIISILTSDMTDLQEQRSKMIGLGLSYSFIEAIIYLKLIKHMHKKKAISEDIIGRQIKRLHSTSDFDFTKPTTITTSDPTAEKEDSTPTFLKLQHSLQNYLVKKLESRPDSIRSLSEYAMTKLPEIALKKLPLDERQYFLQNCAILFHFSPTFISSFLSTFEHDKKVKSPNYIINDSILSKLTKKQIDHLGETKPDFFNNEFYVQLWFNLHYSQRIFKRVEGSKYFTKVEHDSKRKEFLKIIEELSKHNQHIIKAYLNKLKEEVLFLDVIVNDPSIDRLVELLKTSPKVLEFNSLSQTFIDQSQLRLKNDEVRKHSPKMRYYLQVDNIDFNETIKDYILKLFKNTEDNKENINRLSQFFSDHYLRELHCEALLSKGTIPENVHDYYNSENLQALRDKKELTLHSTNKKMYKVDDPIQLEVSVKNVQTIHVKVYELSLDKQNLYKEGRITDEVNLSFLKPTFEQIHKHKIRNPYQVEDITISVNIEKKMGTFIIDLHGETVTSRAIIRKGAILCLEELTEAGQKFSFYDEEGRPLTEEQGLKVWFNERLTSLKGTNFIESEYQVTSTYAKIVACVGSYSQSYEKKLMTEQYKFDVGYLFNTESFLVGKKAKIILHGRLSMNDSPMSLQLLNSTKATVNITNHQNISTFYEFDLDQWKDSEDKVIEFPIQPYARNILVTVSSKIILQTKKQQILASSKEINIDLGESNTNFCDFYLEQSKESSYILNVLGMNGQPIPNADVVLTYDITGVDGEEKSSVKTDKNGRIHIESLSIASNLSALMKNGNSKVERSWVINETASNFNYAKKLYIKIGQNVSLPVNHSWTNNDIIFLRTFDQYFAEDLSNKVKVSHGKLNIETIDQQGYYVLKLLPLDKTIQIFTIKNLKWQGDTAQNQKVYDKSEGKILEVQTNLYQNISIQGAKIDDKKETKQVHIDLGLDGLSQQKLQKVRVHVFATNYIPNEVAEAFNVENYNVSPQFKETYSVKQDSTYYSNKNLSDEGAYVWNRQQKKETIVGNNLEKPGIFLKRALVRETHQEDEQLNDQDQYEDEAALMSANTNVRNMLKGAKRPQSKLAPIKVSPLSTHNNFLLLSGYLQNNLKGSTIKVDVPSSYNSLSVVVLTPATAIRKSFSLGEVEHKKLKDLRHAGLPQTKGNKAWTMSRQVYTLNAGQQIEVNRNSQWRTVGLKDIFEFAQAKGFKLYDWNNHLLAWHNYSEEKKREIYDKECCHELNTFLKFKDPQFFSRVVSKYIANKISKTFVDYCLLGDAKAIFSYTSVEKLPTLNAFEKVLLVHTLKSSQQGLKQAERIVNMMESEQNAKKKDYVQFKNNFDTIINARAETIEVLKPSSSRKVHDSNTRFTDTRTDQRQRGLSMEFFSRNIATVGRQPMERRERKMQQKKAFVPVEDTKQYTEKTYYNVVNYKTEAPTLVQSSSFWSALAKFLLTSNSTTLLSKQFMDLRNGIDFILAACFISSQSSANFDLLDQERTYKLIAKSPMLLYVKEMKQIDFSNKFGVQINQRFLDPQDMYTVEEDGTRIEKEVEEFIVERPYICQTVVTNTSGTPLQLQILLDIPKGTIPLCSHEYTQVVSMTLNQFTSQEFKRFFYAPSEGQFPIYPSNACRGSSIIAKCNQMPDLQVKKHPTINKLESFQDILRSGDHKQVLKFLETKNIFDSNVFNPNLILWMLKDKEFYQNVIDILRERKMFEPNIWNYAFYHWDYQAISEIVSRNPKGDLLEPAVFEYFPYYSTRTHQFANESKSTIRNVQFKESYLKFLVGSIVQDKKQAAFIVTHAYYLILQDRLRDAQELLDIAKAKYPREFQIQTDYMRCFLNMSLNTHNFTEAREIVKKYLDYPVQSWAKLFKEVKQTLDAQDEEFVEADSGKKNQEFHTQVIQEIGQFKIIQPADTSISVEFFELNIELFFSEMPFSESNAFTFIKPSLVKVFPPSNETQEIIVRRSDYPNLKDATVEITATKNNLPPKRITSFSWANPEVKVKANENAGSLQVFVSKKKQPGAYVKVFSKKGNSNKFYRDGYTDMTGTFRYAMSDLDEISEFSILVLTDKGGSILRVKPPSKLASY